MVYEIRIVKRGEPDNQIIDFLFDYVVKTKRQVKLKIDELIKDGYTYDDFDVVMYEDDSLDCYRGTLDAYSLKDMGY